MAKTISVRADGREIYSIRLTDHFNELCTQMEKLGYERTRKICIVTDSNVGTHYGAQVKACLQEEFDFVALYTFAAGERHKNLATVEGLYEFLIKHRFERGDLLLALGGGVVGDLTGFTAATYLRGIDFIQVPTTLLAQVDSSIGGKTGVDFMQYKNMVGAFYQPRLVYINSSVLTSLPDREIVSGMGEIIKHGLIRDASYFGWLKKNRRAILERDLPTMEEMVAQSCLIKREVVEQDPKEQGERALLNFGHTIGHAVEKLCDFSLSHGACVGIGMMSAAYLSMKAGHIDETSLKEIKDCLRSFGFETSVGGIDPKEILSATKSDKKMVGGQIKFILLRKPGEAYIERGLTDEQLLDGISYICRLEDM